MKTTLIHRYDGSAKLIYEGNPGKEFLTGKDARIFANSSEIDVEIVHGRGANLLGVTVAEDFGQRDDSLRFELERMEGKLKHYKT